MVYRTTATRLERDEVTREHILNCALQQVADSGFGALTMSGLARAAGIATGSLYRHFPGKGALISNSWTNVALKPHHGFNRQSNSRRNACY